MTTTIVAKIASELAQSQRRDDENDATTTTTNAATIASELAQRQRCDDDNDATA
jgi:hypothetical protein